MRNNSFEDITKHSNKKISNYILEKQNPGKILFIFDHGLGDVIEFLPLFEYVKNTFSKWQFKIGIHKDLHITNELHEDIIQLDDLNPAFTIPYGTSIVQDNKVFKRYRMYNYAKIFTYIFAIQFYDYRYPTPYTTPMKSNKLKVDMCKVAEFGFSDNVQLPEYKIKIIKQCNYDIPDNTVCVHFNGHTDKAMKTPLSEIQKQIWQEVIDSGFFPLDIHQNSKVQRLDSKQDIPDWMNVNNTIRDENISLSDLISIISNSKKMIGIVSGPLCMASNILGGENCLMLEGKIKAEHYVRATKHNIIDIFNYKNGSVKDFLLNN